MYTKEYKGKCSSLAYATFEAFLFVYLVRVFSTPIEGLIIGISELVGFEVDSERENGAILMLYV